MKISVSIAQKPLILPLQPHKLLYADTVHRAAVATNDSLLLAEAYYLYGKTYEAAGDLLTSQRWFLKSQAILEPRGDSYNLSRLYGRLSDNEARQGHYSETIRYARLALGVAQRIRSEKALDLSYAKVIGFYERDWSNKGKQPQRPKPNLDSVRHYIHLRESIMQPVTDSLAILNRTYHVGKQLWDDKKDPVSLTHLKQALAMSVRLKEPVLEIAITNEIGRIYLEMSKMTEARQWLDKSEQFLKQSPFRHSYNEQYGLAVINREYYLKFGDWRQAYEYSEKAYALERTNYISDRDGAVTRLEMEYETEKKEALLKSQQKELALHSESISNQQRFIWTMLALLMLTIGMSFVFFRLYRRNQRISTQNAQLVMEQNHRVKNNLQVVSSLLNLQVNRLADDSARKAVEESQLRVQAMATLHRRLYDGDELVKVQLPEFMAELVQDALAGFGYGYLQPDYVIAPVSLLADQALPLGLILNELTTNACKYAFPNQDEPAFRVSCQQQQNSIIFQVSDNGPGYAHSTELMAKRPKTFGMRLIQMQVEQLRGTYKFVSEQGAVFTLVFTI
ncbi:hypothetical protein GCM10028807_19460 [Spirosoma daeguense]